MRLASLKSGRDGQLVVVSSDLARFLPAPVPTLQAALDDLGFDPGPADGLLGPATRGAIRAFQEANDLPVTGRPSPELARALRAAGRTAQAVAQ